MSPCPRREFIDVCGVLNHDATAITFKGRCIDAGHAAVLQHHALGTIVEEVILAGLDILRKLQAHSRSRAYALIAEYVHLSDPA